MTAQAGIPEGFELDPRFQPHTFSGLVGPFCSRRQGNDLSLQYLISANFRIARTRTPEAGEPSGK